MDQFHGTTADYANDAAHGAQRAIDDLDAGRGVPLTIPTTEVPPGRMYFTHTEHPDTAHDVPADQSANHLTFDNPRGLTCLCEPTVEPYRGGLRIVHNTFA